MQPEDSNVYWMYQWYEKLSQFSLSHAEMEKLGKSVI